MALEAAAEAQNLGQSLHSAYFESDGQSQGHILCVVVDFVMEIVLNEPDAGVRVVVVLSEGGFLAFSDESGSKKGKSHPSLVVEELVRLHSRISAALDEIEIRSLGWLVRFYGVTDGNAIASRHAHSLRLLPVNGLLYGFSLLTAKCHISKRYGVICG